MLGLLLVGDTWFANTCLCQYPQVNNATARNNKKNGYVYGQAKTSGTNITTPPSPARSPSLSPNPFKFPPTFYESLFYPFMLGQLSGAQATGGFVPQQNGGGPKQQHVPTGKITLAHA